jgi:hypothetical protein
VARVFFAVGLLDQDAVMDEAPWGGFITNLRDLMAVLERRKYRGFESTRAFFEEETHNSVIGASVSRGLRYIYGTEEQRPAPVRPRAGNAAKSKSRRA